MTRLFLIAVPTIPHFKPPLLGGLFFYKCGAPSHHDQGLNCIKRKDT